MVQAINNDPAVSRIVRLRAVFFQFVRFGIVGFIGFLVDSGVLYAARPLGAGLYGGRVISYLCAATTTWALNRKFTFSVQNQDGKSKEWGRFVAVNLIGGLVNYGVYSAMVYKMPLVAQHPVIAVGAGSLSGMFINFTLSKKLVFREEAA